MQEVASRFGLRRRAIRFLVGGVLAHNKNVHWFARGGALVAKFVLHALEEIVIPGKQDSRGRKFDRLIAEVDVADVAAETSMPAGLDQQRLGRSSRARCP